MGAGIAQGVKRSPDLEQRDLLPVHREVFRQLVCHFIGRCDLDELLITLSPPLHVGSLREGARLLVPWIRWRDVMRSAGDCQSWRCALDRRALSSLCAEGRTATSLTNG